MRFVSLSLLFSACVIFDTSPARDRLRELTDVDADGSTLAEGDCNDADPLVFPGAPELCDGLDNDCDEAVDEDGGETVWCLDHDGDGHGDASTSDNACTIPADGVTACDDCADGDPAVHPLADELCNGVDDNCDLITDDPASADASTWYRDEDADGYGVVDVTTVACELPDGFADRPDDCDDARFDVNPGMIEACNNGVDDNCDGLPDGCGFAGEEVLEPHGVSGVDGGYIAGPAGTAENLGFGVYVTDVTADGEDDIILTGLADMYGEPDGGSVHFWYGAPVGYQEVSGAGGHLYGPSGMFLGYDHGVLSTDTDGDGQSEVLIGAPASVAGFPASGGLMRFGPGVSGTREVQPADLWFAGRTVGEGFGTGLQRADGLVGGGEYLLVGAELNSEVAENAGKIYVFDLGAAESGTPVMTVSGTSDSDLVGYYEPPLLDLDGDGYDDLVLGTPYHDGGAGAVDVFYGPMSGDYTLADADAIITDSRERDVGRGVTTVIDPSGSGAVIVSTAGVDDGDFDGAAYILTGGARGAIELSEAAVATLAGEPGAGGAFFGFEGGDLDGDGGMDLVVTDSNHQGDGGAGSIGAVYLFHRPLGLTGTHDLAESADAVFYGRGDEDAIGLSLAIGDANHDGRNDLLFYGADSEAGWQAGGAYFLLGEGM